MKMRQAIYIAILLTAAISAAGWRTDITVRTGGERSVAVGMAAGATAGFDRELDKPAPPMPPVGPYVYFALEDSAYEYLGALWEDIRSPADSASWTLDIRRAQSAPSLIFRGLPDIGCLEAGGVRITREGSAYSFSPEDTVMNIRYRGGVYETAETEIVFDINSGVEVDIVISTPSGGEIRRIEDIYLTAGERTIPWNGKDDSGNRVPAGRYIANLTGKSNDMELETEVNLGKSGEDNVEE